eukprot:scaffold4142_cov118-Isochrysis_galbana.AAC.3
MRRDTLLSPGRLALPPFKKTKLRARVEGAGVERVCVGGPGARLAPGPGLPPDFGSGTASPGTWRNILGTGATGTGASAPARPRRDVPHQYPDARDS